MKILVISDSHGSYDKIISTIRKNSKAEIIAFCGDGHSDIEEAKKYFPDKMFLAVRGNCDWCCDFPYLTDINLCGRKMIVTHGHLQRVKEGYSILRDFAKGINADIALFGHTHSPYLDYDGRVLIMNPGSLGYNNEYGILDIAEDGSLKAALYPKNKYNPPICLKAKESVITKKDV